MANEDRTGPAGGWRFTVAGSRAADREAIEDWGIPGLVLMEHAALAVVAAVEAEAGPADAARVLVIAGPGNNGGDGWATARLLDHRRALGRGGPGARVSVATVGPPPETGDAAVQRRLAGRLGLDAGPFDPEAAGDAAPDVVVDAMLGIGGTRPLGGGFAAAAARLAAWRDAGARIVAVDVPSGLDADAGRPIGTGGGPAGSSGPAAVAADVTVSFHGPKVGYAVAGADRWTGRVVVGDVGVPAPILRRHAAAVPEGA